MRVKRREEHIEKQARNTQKTIHKNPSYTANASTPQLANVTTTNIQAHRDILTMWRAIKVL